MCGEEFVAFCGSELAQISNVIFRTFDLGYQFISGASESIRIRRFEKRAGRPGRRCDDGLLARLPAIAVKPTHAFQLGSPSCETMVASRGATVG
jgi:hypothetical protein